MTIDRARDALGRPLPADADPRDAVAGVPPRAQITDQQAWDEGIAYLDQGLPFHAHETFEMRWRQAPPDDRAAWQALAQWGAALTHLARGNGVGAVRVAERALAVLGAAPHVPAAIDVERVRSSCRRLMAADTA